jgi:hypothetical protein
LPNTIGLADNALWRSYCRCKESVGSIGAGFAFGAAVMPTSREDRPSIFGTAAHPPSMQVAAARVKGRRPNRLNDLSAKVPPLATLARDIVDVSSERGMGSEQVRVSSGSICGRTASATGYRLRPHLFPARPIFIVALRFTGLPFVTVRRIGSAFASTAIGCHHKILSYLDYRDRFVPNLT